MFEFLGEKVMKIPMSQTADRVDGVVRSSRKLLDAVGIRFHNVDWAIFDEPLINRSATWRLEALYDRQEQLGNAESKGRETPLALSIAPASFRHPEMLPNIEAINADARADSENVAEALLRVVWLHRQSLDAQKWTEARRSKGSGGAS